MTHHRQNTNQTHKTSEQRKMRLLCVLCALGEFSEKIFHFHEYHKIEVNQMKNTNYGNKCRNRREHSEIMIYKKKKSCTAFSLVTDCASFDATERVIHYFVDDTVAWSVYICKISKSAKLAAQKIIHFVHLFVFYCQFEFINFIRRTFRIYNRHAMLFLLSFC